MNHVPYLALLPEAMALAKRIYQAFNGDTAKTKAELKRMADVWSPWDAEKARTDAELDKIFPRKP